MANLDGFQGAADTSMITTLLNGAASEASRATSPGGGPILENGLSQDETYKNYRTRPRTYPYFKNLPYEVEDQATRLRQLNEIINNLYITLEAGDFSPGAVHWTKELRSWLTLKFDPPREVRVRLAKLYHELSLAPGIDQGVSERFASMFMMLTK